MPVHQWTPPWWEQVPDRFWLYDHVPSAQTADAPAALASGYGSFETGTAVAVGRAVGATVGAFVGAGVGVSVGVAVGVGVGVTSGVGVAVCVGVGVGVSCTVGATVTVVVLVGVAVTTAWVGVALDPAGFAS